MTDYRDPNPISPTEPEYNQKDVPKEILNYSNQVRQKMHGRDVRESLARAGELAGAYSKEASETAMDIWESWQQINMEWDSDPNKDPEIIAARGEYDSLDARLTNERDILGNDLDDLTEDLSALQQTFSGELKQLKETAELSRQRGLILSGNRGSANAINSWWTYPLASYDANRYQFYIGGVDNQGQIYVELYHSPSKKVLDKVGLMNAAVDDHNAPCIINCDGLIRAFYTEHGNNNILRFRFQRSNREDETKIDFQDTRTVTFPDRVNYVQAAWQSDTRRIWLVCRVGLTAWNVLVYDLNVNDWVLNKKFVDLGEGNQAYMKIKNQEGLLRFAITKHAAREENEIYSAYIRMMPSNGSAPTAQEGTINVDGNSIGNVFDSGFSGINVNNLNKAYDTQDSGKKVRLLDVARDGSLLICEFTDNDDGVYKCLTFSGGVYTERFIVEAGRVIGASGSHYYGGAAFGGGSGSSFVYVSRYDVDSESWVMESRNLTSGAVSLIEKSDSLKLFRPNTIDRLDNNTNMMYVAGLYGEEGYREYDTMIKMV
jgi:hypothetical protein